MNEEKITSDASISMETRRVYLRPVLDGDYPFLYAVATNPRLMHRWSLRGVIPSYGEFVNSFRKDVLTQFIVVRNDDEAPQQLGLVSAESSDLHSGFVSISVIASDDAVGTGVMMDGIGLLIEYLFYTWPFRKIYVEASEFAFDQYRSIVKRGIFVIEGTMTDHLYLDGQYWDQHVLATTRDRWITHGRPMVRRAQRVRKSREI